MHSAMRSKDHKLLYVQLKSTLNCIESDCTVNPQGSPAGKVTVCVLLLCCLVCVPRSAATYASPTSLVPNGQVGECNKPPLEGALAERLVAGTECDLSCTQHFLASAAKVTCGADGTWTAAQCTGERCGAGTELQQRLGLSGQACLMCLRCP